MQYVNLGIVKITYFRGYYMANISTDKPKHDRNWYTAAIKLQIETLGNIGNPKSQSPKSQSVIDSPQIAKDEIMNLLKESETLKGGGLKLAQFDQTEETLNKAVKLAYIRRAKIYHGRMKNLATDPEVLDGKVNRDLSAAGADKMVLYPNAKNPEDAEEQYHKYLSTQKVNYENKREGEEELIKEAQSGQLRNGGTGINLWIKAILGNQSQRR